MGFFHQTYIWKKLMNILMMLGGQKSFMFQPCYSSLTKLRLTSIWTFWHILGCSSQDSSYYQDVQTWLLWPYCGFSIILLSTLGKDGKCFDRVSCPCQLLMSQRHEMLKNIRRQIQISPNASWRVEMKNTDSLATSFYYDTTTNSHDWSTSRYMAA